MRIAGGKKDEMSAKKTLKQIIETHGGMSALAAKYDLSENDLNSTASLIGTAQDGNNRCNVYGYADGNGFLFVAQAGLVIESELPEDFVEL